MCPQIPRDIPNQSIIAGNNKTNLRQLLMQKMQASILLLSYDMYPPPKVEPSNKTNLRQLLMQKMQAHVCC